MEPKKQTYFLEMIKEIKSMYYVGTQEAFKVVRRIEQDRTLLRELAESVDSKVQAETGGEYRATEERVCSFWSVFQTAKNPLRLKLEVRNDELYSQLSDGEMNATGNFSLIMPLHCDYDQNDPDRAEAVQIYAAFFSELNRRKIRDDKAVGPAVADFLESECKRAVMAEDAKAYVSRLAGYIRTVDFGAIADVAYAHYTNKALDDAINDYLKKGEVIRRMRRDQVENKMEYVRPFLEHQVLSQPLIELLMKATILSRENEQRFKLREFNSEHDDEEDLVRDTLQKNDIWGFFVRCYDKFISGRTALIAKGEDEDGEVLRSAGIGAMELHEELLKDEKYIRLLLGREKSWVTKITKKRKPDL